MTPDPDLLEKLRADLVDQYVLERELGHGGMGLVFLATEQRLGRKVAIKILPPSFSFGALAVERFLREARTAATLDHPHIIPIYRVSDTGSLHWFSMKFIEGESLGDLLEREHTVSFPRAAHIVRQAAEALHYAHSKGVIHRDVKPGNVMVGADGWVTVTDFGIAKAAGNVSITGSGSMMGTPYYMSPEQCAGTELSPAADQYSLAVVAYQMLSGRVPFGGETAVDIIKKHCFDPVPPITQWRPEVPPALGAVVERALAKEGPQRFATVAEFADMFERAARGEAVEVVLPSGERQRFTARVAPRRWRRWAVLGATVSLLGLALFLWARPRPSSLSPPAPSVVPAATVVEIQVAPPTLALRVGERSSLVATALDSAGRALRNETFDWSSSNSRVVAVDSRTGILIGVAPGVATIVAQTGEHAGQSAVRVSAAAAPSPTPSSPPPASLSEVGYLTVGSTPLAAMAIDGRSVASNPVVEYAVPAGTVRLRFTVTEAGGGTWSYDTTVAVAPREHRNIGRVRLQRP